MKIYKDILTQEQLSFLAEYVKNVTFKPCQSWLGNFEVKAFYGNSVDKTDLKTIVDALRVLSPEQEFNVCFLQKYPAGSKVLEHRDPFDNKDNTIIAVFGDFTGAESTIGSEKVKIDHGQVLVMPCTVGSVRGPKHSVTEVLSGTRYALILNTIYKK